MDHFFWIVSSQLDDHQFAGILWYIRKEMNNKVLSNLDIDPRETLRLAETESTLWVEAQIPKRSRDDQQAEPSVLPSFPRRWCFTDGSWKDKDTFSGQGWYSTLTCFDGLMGARNTRASLSPLHAEIEALLWTMELQHIILNW